MAATYEAADNEKLSSSFPMTVLLYVEVGNKHHSVDGHVKSFAQGSYLLIRKFTDGVLYKTLRPGQTMSKSYAFALTDEYVRKIISEFSIPPDLEPVKDRIVGLKKNDLLVKLMSFVKKSLDDGTDLDKNVLNEKTREALSAIIKADPKLAAAFREYTLAQRVDLEEFMNQSFLLRLPLKMLANQSGRSLSTFHRDFKMIFAETPHRWIMRKRLSLARDLLNQKDNTPSGVYVNVGFEDLAHFSRAFKKEFGYPPSRTLKKEKIDT